MVIKSRSRSEGQGQRSNVWLNTYSWVVCLRVPGNLAVPDIASIIVNLSIFRIFIPLNSQKLANERQTNTKVLQ